GNSFYNLPEPRLPRLHAAMQPCSRRCLRMIAANKKSVSLAHEMKITYNENVLFWQNHLLASNNGCLLINGTVPMQFTNRVYFYRRNYDENIQKRCADLV
ncbi:MAG: hypothetical protein RR696_06715, partial [Clostridia bacterium]